MTVIRVAFDNNLYGGASILEHMRFCTDCTEFVLLFQVISFLKLTFREQNII